jgi:hypothetical protein
MAAMHIWPASEDALSDTCVEVDALAYTDEELVRIAMELKPGSCLKIRNSASRSSHELSRIASATAHKVIVA